MNKKIIIGLCLLSLLMVGCGCNKKKEKKQDVKQATGLEFNLDVIGEQEVNGLKFTNVSMITENGMTTFKCDVTNTTSSTYSLKTITIVFKDKNDKEIDSTTTYIGDSILIDHSSKLKAQLLTDVTKASSVEYIINK